jgi:UDP-D-galactose:(glucosyl)LPS alpha-1,6-D-galactosyltransferase
MIIDIVLGYAFGRGGLENVIKLVHDELKRRGHEVRVFQLFPPRYRDWAESIGDIYYYGDNENYASPINQQRIDVLSGNYEQMTRLLGRPAVILATHTPIFSRICRMAVEKMQTVNKPVILSWLHGPPNVFGGGDLLSLCDAHLAISGDIAGQLKTYAKADNVFYVGNPIDFNDISVFKRHTGTLKIAYVGRINNSQKRLDILFAGLANLQGEWQLDIVGDGPDTAVLVQKAHQIGVDQNIIWHGWSNTPWKELTDPSLLVLSSDYEGFGLVVVEALARGLPVISTDCEGPCDMIQNGVNGWLFPHRDSQALQQILQDIINKTKLLPNVKACVRSAETYRVENVVDRMESAIFKTIKMKEAYFLLKKDAEE